jgi:RNA polymerase sigma-70 factor (ECF subfamily)
MVASPLGLELMSVAADAAPGALIASSRRGLRRSLSMNIALEQDFALAIVTHVPALRRYARLLTRTADQADDLVQDCVTRALSRSHLYQTGSNLKAWLRTMLRNIAITQTRKAKFRQDGANEQMEMSSQVTPPNQLDRVALRESLRDMKTLPAAQRQAVTLLGILEMTYDEAALHSGLPIGTLKSRLSRGRARLRHSAAPVPEAACTRSCGL